MTQWKLSCYMLPYRNATPERAFQGIAQVGFKYVTLSALKTAPQLNVEEMSAPQVADLRKLLERTGLKAVAIGAHHAAHTEEGKEWIRRRIDLAHLLGAEVVDISAPKMIPADASQKERRELALQQRNFFRNVAELGAYAADRGIRIAIETHGGLTGTGVMCKHALKQIGAPAVGIAYDPANVISCEGADPVQDIEAIVDRVFHVHLNDVLGRGKGAELCDFGLGAVEYPALLGKLKQAGFGGLLSVEHAAGETPDAIDSNLAQIRERVLQVLERL